MVVSFFCLAHNEKVEDPSHRLHPEFPALPFPPLPTPGPGQKATSTSSDILAVLQRSISGANPRSHFDPAWTRLRAEVQFAQGNLASAVRHFLETIIAQTDYFSKAALQGDLDEKIATKMVTCLLELHYHTYAVAMSQSQQLLQLQGGGAAGGGGGGAEQPQGLLGTAGQTDYTVSFKNLEERHCNDGMDGMYR